MLWAAGVNNTRIRGEGMSEFMRCAPSEANASGAASVRVKGKGGTRVIDIHCHLNIPAADAVLGRYIGQAIGQFSNPQTDRKSVV